MTRAAAPLLALSLMAGAASAAQTFHYTGPVFSASITLADPLSQYRFDGSLSAVFVDAPISAELDISGLAVPIDFANGGFVEFMADLTPDGQSIVWADGWALLIGSDAYIPAKDDVRFTWAWSQFLGSDYEDLAYLLEGAGSYDIAGWWTGDWVFAVNSPGVWTDAAAPSPELSTWISFAIGIAGLLVLKAARANAGTK